MERKSTRRPRRTKQRSLTKFLFKPFGTDDDASGNTAPIRADCSEQSSTPRKSCMKQSTALVFSPKKSVTFDKVQVREYEMILGDNPSVSSGPPLAIAWNSHSTLECTVNDYEQAHPTRRNKASMLVPRMVREEWLRNAGYARSDFVEMERILTKIKKSRSASAVQQASFVSKVWKSIR